MAPPEMELHAMAKRLFRERRVGRWRIRKRLVIVKNDGECNQRDEEPIARDRGGKQEGWDGDGCKFERC